MGSIVGAGGIVGCPAGEDSGETVGFIASSGVAIHSVTQARSQGKRVAHAVG